MWTKEPPNEPGFYWFRYPQMFPINRDDNPTIVRMLKSMLSDGPMTCAFPGNDYCARVDDPGLLAGDPEWWSEPIAIPVALQFLKEHEVQSIVVADLQNHLPGRTKAERMFTRYANPLSLIESEDLLSGLLTLATRYRLRIEAFWQARETRKSQLAPETPKRTSELPRAPVKPWSKPCMQKIGGTTCGYSPSDPIHVEVVGMPGYHPHVAEAETPIRLPGGHIRERVIELCRKIAAEKGSEKFNAMAEELYEIINAEYRRAPAVLDVSNRLMRSNGMGAVVAIEEALEKYWKEHSKSPEAIKVADRTVFTIACCYPKQPPRDNDFRIIPVTGYVNKFTGKILPVLCDQDSLVHEWKRVVDLSKLNREQLLEELENAQSKMNGPVARSIIELLAKMDAADAARPESTRAGADNLRERAEHE